ncbi:hypothetical protein INT47_000500, partial [Mucor saturninus]
STRLGLQPARFRHTPKHIARLTTSIPPTDKPTEKPVPDNSPFKHLQDASVEKTLAATKAYFDKVQLDLKPRLEPYLTKINHASEQLKRLTSDVSDSKEALRRASRAMNELTGYDQIDAVKQKVNNQAQLFESTRDQVQEAKRNYEQAIETRSSTQRGINELLQRKHLWTGDDVTQFTELYRLEHAHSQAEMQAKEAYQMCEKKMDREYMELARSIMERYHEEQLWSDKIRSVSTYGTWALMVVNLLLFVAVQTVFEPRKRKRLTDRFEELLVSKVDEEEEKFKHVFQSLDDKDKLLMQQQVAVMETLNSLAEHPLFDPETVQALKASSQQRENIFPVPIAPVLPDLAMQDETPVPSQPEAVTQTEGELTAIPESPSHPNAASAPEIASMPETTSLPEAGTLPESSEVQTAIITKTNEVKLDNEELRKLLLLTAANFDEAPFYKEKKKEEQVILSKRDLVLYSIESAVAGGLVTALAVYFFR